MSAPPTHLCATCRRGEPFSAEAPTPHAAQAEAMTLLALTCERLGAPGHLGCPLAQSIAAALVAEHGSRL